VAEPASNSNPQRQRRGADAPQTPAKQRELLEKGGLSEHLSSMPLGRTGYPDDLAKVVLFMASDLASYASGTLLTVDGAQTLR
jgi:NAD(P)-dependent dehydrogenase (short-subunit alcohol dehydrogenase family)